MTVKQAFDQVESLDFAAYANIASTFQTFIDALQGQESTQVLLKHLNSTDAYLEVLHRVLALCNEEHHNEYANPNDVALATYVFVLANKHEGIALAASNNVLKVPQLWWASHMSRQVLLSRKAGAANKRWVQQSVDFHASSGRGPSWQVAFESKQWPEVFRAYLRHLEGWHTSDPDLSYIKHVRKFKGKLPKYIDSHVKRKGFVRRSEGKINEEKLDFTW